MLIPANRVLDALIKEFDKLRPLLADSGTDGSGAQAVAHALRLMQARQSGDIAALRAQFTALESALDTAAPHLGPHAATQLSALRALLATADDETSLDALESLWRESLAATESLVAAFNSAPASAAARQQAARIFSAWEAGDLTGQMHQAAQKTQGPANEVDITSENLTAYLRARFNEPGLEVTSLTPLAGGFGKQTTIFAVKGQALSGEFVMRRDLGDNAGLDNDCHLIMREYPVIRAAHERGFPAPDALWLDTEHHLLPGGDFIIMRKSEGVIGGNFFGASTEIPTDLADALAGEMAKLHNLEPLRELGDLTDSIRAELWDMDLTACITRYIRNWYSFYLAESHMPSPAITAIYGWLLENVPQRAGKPSLLHGDIGFHNFLFHEGKMSALLDWEFAHLGDPAEELGYVKVTVGASLDWERFIARYTEAGGRPVDAQTLHYFQVWAFMRNATAANIFASRFNDGLVSDLKLTVLPYLHIPNFIRGAQALIESYPP